MMKRNKIIAGLAIAGSMLAVSSASYAIAPAAALGLAVIGGAAVGSAAAEANEHHHPNTVSVVPAAPATVVMGAAPAPVVTGHYEVNNGVYTWVQDSPALPTVSNYDHDGDGVLNNVDRYPNDPARS